MKTIDSRMYKNNNNPCLWLHVEGNTNKGGGGRGAGQPNKNLEQEAIRCVTHWKKNTKYPIYALCMTDNPPSMETLSQLTYKGVKFIWNYSPNSDWFPAGWWNTPLAGKWMEDNTNHFPLIHIDLDMTLLRPFELTDDWINYDAIIPAYTKENPDDKQIDPDFPKTFITCFIISNKIFYNMWYAKMMELAFLWWQKFPNLLKNPEKVSKEVWWDYCNLEEHAVDVLYYQNNLNIKKLNKVMIGESQGYGSAKDATDEEIKNDIYFLHYHHDRDNPKGFRDKILEYAKRAVKCRK